MSLSRRTVLSGLSSLPLSVSLPTLALGELRLGDATLTTVSDGSLVLPGSFIFDPMPEAELAEILTQFDLSGERLTPECNLALFQDGPRKVLFDVGSGPDFMPSAGTVQDSLAALGLEPSDITHVVFTHAHPDHIWGLLDDFDEPLFTEAAYLMGRDEWNYWWDPDTVNTIGDARAAFAVGARRRMEIIAEQIQLFDDGAEILPGIAAIASYGHTPGHMSFEIRNGSQAALIAGDAIGNHHVAFHKPSWHSGSDQDMERAAATRLRLFDRIVEDDLTLIGFHLPEGGIGRVATQGDAYRFAQEEG